MENKVKIWGGKFPEYRYLSCSKKWLEAGVYYKIHIKSDCIVLERVYTIDAPKCAHICTKGWGKTNRFFFNAGIPLGVYDIDLDESDEDQLVILL